MILKFLKWLLFPTSQHERKMCRSKVRFKTYIDAQAALDRINPGNRKRNKPSRYYKCPYCSGYHLTRSQGN